VRERERERAREHMRVAVCGFACLVNISSAVNIPFNLHVNSVRSV
jgi:hypothetical protein